MYLKYPPTLDNKILRPNFTTKYTKVAKLVHLGFYICLKSIIRITRQLYNIRPSLIIVFKTQFVNIG